MSLAVQARLYKWVCYRCVCEVQSPADARCPACGFALVIECEEPPPTSLWRDEMIQAQRALRLPAPLLLVKARRILAEDLLPPPEVVASRGEPPAPASPLPEGQPSTRMAGTVSVRQSVFVFAGVALATFIVGCALATMFHYGF